MYPDKSKIPPPLVLGLVVGTALIASLVTPFSMLKRGASASEEEAKRVGLVRRIYFHLGVFSLLAWFMTLFALGIAIIWVMVQFHISI